MGAGLLIEEQASGMKAPERITAVVPAYNEEPTIGAVVALLCAHPLVGEVVVVSDGSTDRTAHEARQAGARVIELPENLGKGAALRAGVAATKADVVLFLDADLIGLTHEHIDNLLSPVVDGNVEMAVGLFDGGRRSTELAQSIAPFLSGQRAVRRTMLEGINDLDEAGFGAEVALTRFAKKNGNRVSEVFLKDVTHQTKEEKRGFVKGFAARIRMYWEIARYLADSNNL